MFAYATAEQRRPSTTAMVARAEAMLRHLGLEFRVLDLCTGDLGNSSAGTFDLEVYLPGWSSGSRSPR